MVNQNEFDTLLFSCLGYGPSEEYIDDCKTIQDTLKQEFNIFLSICECANFWHWRSEQYDASWLTLSKNYRKEIKEFFIEYLKYLKE